MKERLAKAEKEGEKLRLDLQLKVQECFITMKEKLQLQNELAKATSDLEKSKNDSYAQDYKLREH